MVPPLYGVRVNARDTPYGRTYTYLVRPALR
jgi:hypothetical protein